MAHPLAPSIKGPPLRESALQRLPYPLPRPTSRLPEKVIPAMEQVMKDVYGDWDDAQSGFPIPMPASEAGICVGGQRRYLWTDAFGVLNFITLAERSTIFREKYLACAESLVQVVHQSLGVPRGVDFPMLATNNSRAPFKGLRIGKVHARRESDYGMDFDGMYWHYLDKWIFALARLAHMKGEAPTAAITLIKDVHPHFCARDLNNTVLGLHWKMNTDLSPITTNAGRASPSNDALSALILYSSVLRGSNLEKERSELQSIVNNYRLRVSSDPLGYGLNWWEMQWLSGPASNQCRESMRQTCRRTLNPDPGDLAFRLYGGIIGAKLSGDVEVISAAEDALNKSMQAEKNRPIGGPHSCINKVMFATALDPWAMERLPAEIQLSI